jgi:hypothetical protein
VSRKLAALAMTVLIAGCGSEAAEPGTSGTTTATATASEAARFSACMREHGVPDFPDPDASGRLTIDAVLNGSSLDADSPAWKQALGACKDLQPSGFTGPGKRNPSQQDQALEFAQCIREHGVKDFPDPEEGEPLVNTNKIPSSATEAGMATLNAAMQACGDAIRDLVQDDR